MDFIELPENREELEKVMIQLKGRRVKTQYYAFDDFGEGRIVGYDPGRIRGIIECKEGTELPAFVQIGIKASPNWNGHVWFSELNVKRNTRFFTKYCFLEEAIDKKKFPHVCPRCSSPAYLGFLKIECSKKCS